MPGELLNPSAPQTKYRTPATVERYIDPLPIPQMLALSEARDGVEIYHVRMLEFSRPMHSQLPPTRRWGYEAQCPGPTIEAVRGKPVEVHWHNNLPSQHIFRDRSERCTVQCPRRPRYEQYLISMAHAPAPRAMGYPRNGSFRELQHTTTTLIDQPAATLWYHDHAAGITRLNNYAGLSGFYLLRDEVERKMSLPAGDYEIPLLIRDRTLSQSGQLVYAPTFDDGKPLPFGVWGSEFFGQLPVVNGSIYPYLDVEPRPYRLRILNAANSRFFNLYFNLAKRPTDIPGLVTFHQIGTDGGFLSSPVALDKVLLGPAERADLIIDFSKFEGKTVTLSNDAAAPYPGWEFATTHHAQLYELMQFRVVLPLTRKSKSVNMTPSLSFSPLNAAESVVTRDFILSEQMDTQGHSIRMLINGKRYDEPVTETVTLGSIEHMALHQRHG